MGPQIGTGLRMCQHCSKKGKKCPCPPKWLVQPKRRVNNLLEPSLALGLRCGQTELRRDEELIVLCDYCLGACWYEGNTVI